MIGIILDLRQRGDPGFGSSRDYRDGKPCHELFLQGGYRYVMQRYGNNFIVFMFGHWQEAIERSDGSIFLTRLAGYLDRCALVEVGDINVEIDCAILVEFDIGYFAVRNQ